MPRLIQLWMEREATYSVIHSHETGGEAGSDEGKEEWRDAEGRGRSGKEYVWQNVSK